MLASALILAAAGGAAIAAMPLAFELRAAVQLCWCCGAGFRLWQTWRRFRGVTGFTLADDGSVEVEAPDGTRSPGAIAPGTVSLARVAWFRCRGTNGRRYAELITRNSQKPDDWRRFRVICRHVSAC